MWSTLCLVSLAFAATTSTPSIVSKYTTQNGNTFIKLSEAVKGYDADRICQELDGVTAYESCSGCSGGAKNGFYDEFTLWQNHADKWLNIEGESYPPNLWVGTTERDCFDICVPPFSWFGCKDDYGICGTQCIYGKIYSGSTARKFAVSAWG
eukprot:204647_1